MRSDCVKPLRRLVSRGEKGETTACLSIDREACWSCQEWCPGRKLAKPPAPVMGVLRRRKIDVKDFLNQLRHLPLEEAVCLIEEFGAVDHALRGTGGLA